MITGIFCLHGNEEDVCEECSLSTRIEDTVYFLKPIVYNERSFRCVACGGAVTSLEYDYCYKCNSLLEFL